MAYGSRFWNILGKVYEETLSFVSRSSIFSWEGDFGVQVLFATSLVWSCLAQAFFYSLTTDCMKLMTEEVLELFRKTGSQSGSSDPLVVCKFFNPT